MPGGGFSRARRRGLVLPVNMLTCTTHVCVQYIAEMKCNLGYGKKNKEGRCLLRCGRAVARAVSLRGKQKPRGQICTSSVLAARGQVVYHQHLVTFSAMGLIDAVIR